MQKKHPLIIYLVNMEIPNISKYIDERKNFLSENRGSDKENFWEQRELGKKLISGSRISFPAIKVWYFPIAEILGQSFMS